VISGIARIFGGGMEIFLVHFYVWANLFKKGGGNPPIHPLATLLSVTQKLKIKSMEKNGIKCKFS